MLNGDSNSKLQSNTVEQLECSINKKIQHVRVTSDDLSLVISEKEDENAENMMTISKQKVKIVDEPTVIYFNNKDNKVYDKQKQIYEETLDVYLQKRFKVESTR